MQRLSRQEAHEIIDSIREDNGGISAEDREKTPASVLRSLENVRRKLGAVTTTLATNLYSKNTRFVFELIQNADDNDYTRATAAGHEPFLSFNTHSDQIVVDSNEDGFTEQDVRAICSVGESTKTFSQGYIGEKGIGFKSVFKIASKVHIQSGPFSFYFEHQEGDSGLGMVTPNYQAHEELPEGVHTRMTLTLSNASHFLQHWREVSEIPDTLIIFLRKLKSISITKGDPGSLILPVATDKYSYNEQGQLGKLTKVSGRSAVQGEEKIQLYLVTRRLLTDLPNESARPHTKKAEVVLAFPINDKFEPIVAQQHVFAFLPLCRAGFSFLIQSDFLTQASREDILQSPWNEAILDGVALTFRDAVVQFCDRPSLQYQWLKYLPSESISGDFWAQLLPKILSNLKVTSVMRPWSQRGLKHPVSLKRLPLHARDKYGNPLFEDLTDELYLSPEYAQPSKTLGDLGVEDINSKDLVKRIEADLGRSTSKYKAGATDEDWHTRVAKLLTRFDKDYPFALLTLQLIPLQNGQWVTGFAKDFFYPDNEGIAIPLDLSLRLIDPKVIKNESRKELFNKLGAKYCAPNTVLDLIMKRYNTYNSVDLKSSVSHLHYFYWKQAPDENTLNPLVYLLDQAKQPIYRKFVTFGKENLAVDDLYFESDDEYGAQQLLKPTRRGEGSHDVCAPGFPAHFIHPDYLKAVPADARRNHLSWEGWLESVAGVRRWPRMVSSGNLPIRLSEVFLYIARERPDKLVGVLKAHWSHYVEFITPEIVKALGPTKVPCEGTKHAPLKWTYLPLPSLKSRCKELGVGDIWSFLQLPMEFEGDVEPEWAFLEVFGVRSKENLEFYLDVLIKWTTWDTAKWAVTVEKNLFMVYEAIQDYTKAMDEDRVKAFFDCCRAVFVGTSQADQIIWNRPEDCVWNAPSFLQVVTPLASIEGYKDNKRLAYLFHDVLGIRDVDWEDYLDELEHRHANNIHSQDIGSVYHELSKALQTDRDRKYTREKFQCTALIYLPEKGSWHLPSSCVWADATRIAGKVAIAAEYAGMKDFFVATLGVKAPNLNMFVLELRALAHGGDEKDLPNLGDIENIKYLINEINCRQPITTTLTTLKALNILPVKDPDRNIRLRSTLHDFVIIDRLEYGEAFSGKLSVLDFSLEEVHALRPFLVALGLGGRYISGKVEEKTVVSGGSEAPALFNAFRQKAYALYRCAVHFDGRGLQSSDRSLYQRLQEAIIFESDGIGKTLSLSQKGHVITVKSSRGNLHIDDHNHRLKIYVPRDPQARELCYFSQLPQRLLGFLSIADIAAREILTSILNSSIYVVDDILKDHGIVQVERLEPLQPESRRDAEPEHSIVEETTAESAFSSGLRLSVPVRASIDTTQSRPASRAPSVHSVEASSTTFQGSPLTPSSTRSPVPNVKREDPVAQRALSFRDDYQLLLGRTIEAAKDATIPAHSPQGVAPTTVASNSESDSDPTLVEISRLGLGVRSENQMSHDMKMGAAGELYVFEVLLGLGLPGFGCDNWKSTIRKEVRVHEKYSDMAPWNGAETADIVYDDVEGDLSFYLTGQGYLPRRPWFNGRPKYYLEVKTTTKSSKTPFFMSKYQYERMQRLSFSSYQTTPSEIYVIIRVFNLGQDNVGMRIYLDPEKMRRDEELIFTPQSYSVAPSETGRNPATLRTPAPQALNSLGRSSIRPRVRLPQA